MLKSTWLKKDISFIFVVVFAVLMAGMGSAAASNVSGTIELEGISNLGTEVSFVLEGGGVSMMQTTNSSGYFSATVDAGNYKIKIQRPNASELWLITINEYRDFSVVNDETLATIFSIDAEYNLPFDYYLNTIDVSGNILLDGPTSEGTILNFTPVGGGTTITPDEVTDNEGTFWVNLFPGSYTVEIQPKGSTSFWLAQDSANNVSVVDTVENASSISIDSVSTSKFEVTVVVPPVSVSGTISLIGTNSQAGSVVRFWTYDVVSSIVMGGVDPYTPVNTTDSNGDYSLEIPPGSYVVEIEPEGSTSLWFGSVSPATLVANAESASVFLIETGSDNRFDASITVALVSVSGSVNLTGGVDTQAGTAVSFYPAIAADNLPVYSGTTGNSGDFSTSLPPGRYTIKLQPEGYSPVWLARDEAGFPYSVLEESAAAVFSFSSDEDANPSLDDLSVESLTIAGRVALSGTVNSEGTVIEFLPNVGGSASPLQVVTDSDGRFVIELLPSLYEISMVPLGANMLWLGPESAGQRTVVEQEDQAVNLVVSSDSDAIFDVNITMQPVTISGVISLSGVLNSVGTDLHFIPDGTDVPISFVDATAESGAYAVELPPGVYTIKLEPQGAVPVWLTLDASGSTTTIDEIEEPTSFLLGNASNRTLSVLLAVAPVPVAGSVMTGASSHQGTEVYFTPVGETEPYKPAQPTNSSGEFELSLPPGMYVIELHPAGYPAIWVGEDDEGGNRTVVTSIEDAATFEIGVNHDANGTFDIYLPPISISGTIKLTGTSSNEGTVVRFWPSVVRFWSVADMGEPSLTADEPTDDHGKFITDLLPGSYIVEVIPSGSNSMWLRQNDGGGLSVVTDIQTASAFDINSEETINFDVTIALPPVTVTGTITLSGMEESQVETELRFFLDGEENDLPFTTSSYASGEFSIDLPPGHYLVEMQPTGAAPVYLNQNNASAYVSVVDTETAMLLQIGDALSSNFEITLTVSPIPVTGTITVGANLADAALLSFTPLAEGGGATVSTTTDSSGVFMADLMPGSYTIKIQVQDAAPVWLGKDVDGDPIIVGQVQFAAGYEMDFNVDANPTYNVGLNPIPVSGTLTLAGIEAQEDAVVKFYPDAVDNVTPFATTTDIGGGFSLDLPPGSYTVNVQASESASFWLDRKADGTFTVVDTADQALSFAIDDQSNPFFTVLVPALPVTGTVTLADAVTQVGTEVHFWPVAGQEALSKISAPATNNTGTFATTLIPGLYTIEVQPSGKASLWLGADVDGQRTVVSRAEKAVAFFVGIGSNQTLTITVAENQQNTLVSLSGTLQLDQQAVAGATVQLWSASAVDPQPIVTETDSSGQYQVSVAPDAYRVEMQLPGKAAVFVGLDENSTTTKVETSLADAYAFLVQTGSAWLTINLDMVSSDQVELVTLSGTINEAQQSVEGAIVRLLPVFDLPGDPLEVSSDRVGGYGFVVTPGLYYMDVQLPGKATVSIAMDVDDQPIVSHNPDHAYAFLLDGTTWSNLDLNFLESETVTLVQLTGTITQQDEAIVAGATLRLWSEADGFTSAVQTNSDAEGEYEMNVAPGSYRLELQQPGQGSVYIAVDNTFPQWPVNQVVASLTDASLYDMQQDTEINIVIQSGVVQTLLGVSGQIQMVDGNTTSAVRGVPVVFKPVAGTGMEEITTMTDVDGNYDVNITAGSYYVEVHANGASPLFVGSDGTPSATEQLLQLSETTTINLTYNSSDLVVLVTVAGNIQWQTGLEAETAQSIAAAGASVYLTQVADTSYVVESITDAEGDYHVEVAPGLYQIRVQVPGYVPVYVAQDTQGVNYPSIDHLESFSFDFQTVVAEGYVVDLADASLMREMIAVTGLVTDASGQGVAGLRVVMQPDVASGGDHDARWQEGKTQEDGSFSIPVFPGSYQIEFQTKYWDGVKEVVVTDTNDEPLTLLAGFADGVGGIISDSNGAHVYEVLSAQTIAVEMSEGITLSGQVINSSGVGVAAAEVDVHRPGSQSLFRTQTDASGLFSVQVDPGRSYVVEVQPEWCETSDATCQAQRETFVSGNLLVTTPETLIVRNAQNEPVITASAANGETVSGTILSTWDSESVTQFEVDQPLNLRLVIDQGTTLTGILRDAAGQGIANAWVDRGAGGVLTDAEGAFSLVLPTSSTGVPFSFQLKMLPPWCDPQASGYTQCLVDSAASAFIGGVVVSRAESYELSSDESAALTFLSDGSDWPANGLVVTAQSGITITGQVTDGNQGLANVWVDAWSYGEAAGNGAMTNSNGFFAIPVVPPLATESHFYEVGVWTSDYIIPESLLVEVDTTGMTAVYHIKQEDDNGTEQSSDDGSAIAIPQPGEQIVVDPLAVNFTLSQGYRVSGRVVDESGNGLPWTWIDLHNPEQSRFFGASTDEQGYYSTRVEAGQYLAVVWGDGENMRTTWYHQATDVEQATLIDATVSSQENIDFLITAGASIRGTIHGATSGQMFVQVWSAETQSWSGKEISLDSSGSTVFQIAGLREASDYQLSWVSDDYVDGYYGGTLAGTAAGPVSVGAASLLDTRGGTVSGVNIGLYAGKTLTLTVSGMQPAEKVEATIWSESLNLGGWAEATVDSAGVATLVMSNVNPTGSDYRLFVEADIPHYLHGNYRASSTEGGAGSLVGWGQATLISMQEDISLEVVMSQGRSISGSISGLQAGQEVWVEAFSNMTHGWSETTVVAAADGTASYTLNGLKRAADYRVGIDGASIIRGYYAGPATQTLVSWDDAARLDVRSEDGVDINLVASPGVSISGSIKGVGEGNGLKKGEWAWLDAWSDQRGSWAGVLVQADSDAANSGATLSYTITGVAASDDYQIYLDVDGYVPQRKEGVDATLSATEVDFILVSGGQISGTISGLQATQQVRVEAVAVDSYAHGGVNVRADSSGVANYMIRGLATGSGYAVSVAMDDRQFYYKSSGITPHWREHTPVAVALNTTTEGIVIDMESAAGMMFSLSGTVSLNPANADQVVEVQVWSEDGAGTPVSINGSGDFSVKGLPAGTYSVAVYADGYIAQRTKVVVVSSGVVNADTLEWTDGWQDVGAFVVRSNITGLNVTLSTGSTLSGTVSRTLTEGGTEMLAGVWVNARGADNGSGAGTITDSSGHYSISGLPDGLYSVEVWTATGSASQSIELNSATSTEYSADLAIIPKLGGVQGSVKSSTGLLKQGVLVLLYQGDAQIAATATNDEGVFQIDGVADGLYTVKVFGEDGFSFDHSYKEVNVNISGKVASTGTLRLSASATP